MSERPSLPNVQYDGQQDLDEHFASFLDNLPDTFEYGRHSSLGLPLDAAFADFPEAEAFQAAPPGEGLAQSFQQGSRESRPTAQSQSRSGGSESVPAPAAASPGQVAPGAEAGPSADRKTRILEKNRRAQKRFRDKQKNKMAEMEAAVEQYEEQLSAATAERACLERQHEVLKKVLDLRQSQVDSLSHLAGVGEDQEMVSLRMSGPTERPEHALEPGLTSDMVRNMSHADAISKWRDYVRSMTALMSQMGPVTPDISCESAKPVRREAGCFVHTLAIVNPSAVKVLMATNFESGAMDESNAVDSNAVDGEFWQRAVEAVNLSAEQRQQVLHATSMLLSKLAQLRRERDMITDTLEATLPTMASENRVLTESIHTMRSLAELRKSFTEEHNAWTDYIAGVLGRILTGPQFGAYCVHSYPFFPNTFQLAKHLATRGGMCEEGQDPDDSDQTVVSTIKKFSEQLQLW